MNYLIGWLENHSELAGWAQFLGAVLALLLTYFTAFAPTWRRKRQLGNAAMRLLANGYEVIESYSRTSKKFTPFPVSLRQASLTMASVGDELNRFPIFELDDQGSNSLARRLVTMGMIVRSVRLVLDNLASELDGRDFSAEDGSSLEYILDLQLTNARALLLGSVLKRPEWSVEEDSESPLQ